MCVRRETSKQASQEDLPVTSEERLNLSQNVREGTAGSTASSSTSKTLANATLLHIEITTEERLNLAQDVAHSSAGSTTDSRASEGCSASPSQPDICGSPKLTNKTSNMG